MASASLNPNGVPTLRPPFKKQASSFGTGHVHNMAVVVASSKVDYSVTKGGLKTWAVLLIFIFLCLTMMAIFKEDGGHDDNYDDASYDTNPFMSGIADEGHFKGAGIEDVAIADQTTKDMDDEIEDESRHQELKLFENLKKKIEKKMRGHVERKNVEKEVPSEVATDKKKDRNVEEIEKVVIEEEEEQEIPIHKEKHRRKKQKRDVEEEVEKVQKKEKHGRKKKVVVENDEEEDPEVVEHKPSHPEPKVEEIVEIVEEDANIPEEVDEVVETENEEEIEAEEPKIHRKKHRNKATLERVKRLNEEYAMKRPRKDLVKKKKSSKNRKNKRNVGEEENEEEDEDLVEEESPELPSKKEKVSLRKSGKTEESELYEIQAVKKPKSLSSYRKTYTNKRDQKFRNKLDMADFHVEKHEFDKATLLFDEVLKQYKESPRSHYGKGRMLEIKAEFENSNALIDQAMVHYQTILDDGEGTEAMVTEASESIIRCARFRGNLHKVLNIQREMIDREPDNLELQNKFGITFLMMGREEEAKKIFSAVLEEDEDNIVAQAYYGYILKVFEKDIVNGVNYMRKSLRNVDSEVNDSKFFYHLGDGLMRLNRRSEAYEIYQRGAELGLFLSTFQVGD
uniref:TPR_REGION domain-containing protein n=1 Tax=Rhabditophanes sp. KR3021 TaxID=114890 RepID=A0AC35TG07_9BILA